MIKLYDFDKLSPREIFARTDDSADVVGAVRDIIDAVKQEGDAALFRFAKQFDRADLSALEVTAEELDAAVAGLEPGLAGLLQEAAGRIAAFHRRQLTNSFVVSEEEGVVLGQKVLPIEKVGLYVPGGTAAYPSSVLMNCIPAKIAGCREIVMVSPPTGGDISPVILAAARIAGADRVFRTGGAQAVAALAYGTETVPRVDKIVGPGNAWVAEAKRQVFGRVAIDMIAGPSEILVVADGASDARQVAADLLSQAEHDTRAAAVLVTDSEELARAVQAELERQIPLLPRADIARASIDDNGKIILTRDLRAAIEVANEIAPEHLELCVDDPFAYLDAVRNAGSVFLGRNCPEALGDYFAGPNHTLPTMGTARFMSPLSVDDFVKRTQFTYYTAAALEKVQAKVARFARQEGLEAHARSVLSRFDNTL